MSKLKSLFTVLFRHFSGARQVRGGSGHFNEQSFNQTYN
jgi:hypothetical protein